MATQIARELNVNALLEGSVARSGNHVRIASGLYDGASDRELWSQNFERELNDVLPDVSPRSLARRETSDLLIAFNLRSGS